jgi:dihydroneopterin aldolase
MPDRIELRGLHAFGYHGVLPEERRDGQMFVVDVGLETDVTAASTSDDLADTVDYGEVAARIAALVQGEPVALIETLAERIAACCLDDVRVRAVDVTVHKPSAPVGVPVDDVVVSVRRERS